MTPETFIKKGLDGGWEYPHMKCSNPMVLVHHIEVIVLDPRMWQAVGRIEGWKQEYRKCNCPGQDKYLNDGRRAMCDKPGTGDYLWRMHSMIDALDKASHTPNFNVQKTIEEFIKTL